eukprot:Tamp_03909.p1 GENE.Tamp_03909~~Tamp_03909.p1  ORF type:complete len:789 (+),score=142.32 Tamp_03909:50-2368(+)
MTARVGPEQSPEAWGGVGPGGAPAAGAAPLPGACPQSSEDEGSDGEGPAQASRARRDLHGVDPVSTPQRTRSSGASPQRTRSHDAEPAQGKRHFGSFKKVAKHIRSALLVAKASSAEAAARRDILKSLNKDLLSRASNDDPCARSLFALLSSDAEMEDLTELIFDRKALRKATSQAFLEEQREMAQRRKADEAASRRKTREEQSDRVPERGQAANRALIVTPVGEEDHEEWHKKMLGLELTKPQFVKMIGDLDRMEANTVVVARVMQEVQAMDVDDRQNGTWRLQALNCYECIDPEGTFMWAWTLTYLLFIAYIATYGLIETAFVVGNPGCDFTVMDWIDFVVDTFFVADIFGRAFVFGQIVDLPGHFSDSHMVVRQPDQVLLRYARGGMAIDVITGVPFSWIIMFGRLKCASTGDGDDLGSLRLIRMIRGTRVTRLLKLFNQPQVRKAIRRLKQRMGHNTLLGIVALLVWTLLLNHIWTCLSWLVQSADLEDRDNDGRDGFEEFQDSIGLSSDAPLPLKYSIMFFITLQNLFAIDPSQGDTMLEAWFGIASLILSVCVHATIVSSILEMWEAINRVRKELDHSINQVTSFLEKNAIDGDLRNEVLEYFEFRLSSTGNQEQDNRLLDALPPMLQSRIVTRLFPQALSSCSLFTNFSEAAVSRIILRMSRNQIRTMPQQLITMQGRLEEQMYLLKSGSAEVVVADENGSAESVANIMGGQCFGELSLWMECRRTASVTSKTFCQLFVLTKDDLFDVMSHFPGLQTHLNVNLQT